MTTRTKEQKEQKAEDARKLPDACLEGREDTFEKAYILGYSARDAEILADPDLKILLAFEAGQREAKLNFIPVDTEPPKDMRKMLLVVTAKGAYRFAHWMNDPIEAGRGFVAVEGAGFQLIEDVIGWLPLPDAPEGGE